MNRPRGAFDCGLRIVCLLLAIGGGLLGYFEIRRASQQFRNELLRTARLLSETVNLRRLTSFSGNASDMFSPEYLRLREQFVSVLSAMPPGRALSLLGRRADGSLFYMLDVRETSPSALPGDGFPARTDAFDLPFEHKRSLLLGPFAEGGRSVYAALVPLAEPGTGRLAAVLLLEADARNGRTEAPAAAYVPWGATLLLILLLLGGRRLVVRFRDSAAFLFAESLWVASIGLALAGAFAWSAGEYEFRTRARAFSVLADLDSGALIRSLQELRDCGLEGLGRFFENSEYVDPAEFADYAGHLVSIPHVDAIFWAPAVPRLSAEPAAVPGRSVSSADAFPDRRPAGAPSMYVLSFPVRYAAPSGQRLLPSGTDLLTIPCLKGAMETALRSGMTTASEVMDKGVGTDETCRMTVFRPVRKAAGDLMGFVAAVINLETLLHTIMFRDEGAEQHIMEVELRRLLPGRQGPVLISVPAARGPDKERGAHGDSFYSQRPFFVLGLTFALDIRSGAGFDRMHPPRAGRLALFSGIAVSMLLTLLTALFLNWRRAMLRFVAIKTVSLAQSEFRSRKLAHLYRSISEGVMITDERGIIGECNAALEELTGYTLEEMQGRSPALFSAREGQYDAEFLRMLRETGSWQGELWNRKKDGEVYPVWASFAPVQDEHGRTTNYSGLMRHIGGVKSEQERLNRMAYHDFLTGLPNRALFLDRLDVALSRAKREEETIALVFLDLDRFKEINDAFGHETGDDLLVEVARRLSGAFREQDTVARLAGDEFVLLFEGMRLDDELPLLLERLKGAFREPFQPGGRTISVEASFGTALFPRDGTDARALLDAADRAMYAEKTARRKRRGTILGTEA